MNIYNKRESAVFIIAEFCYRFSHHKIFAKILININITMNIEKDLLNKPI